MGHLFDMTREPSEWSTPRSVYEPLHEEFGFSLDVAARAENAKCNDWISPEENGLVATWSGQRCWMNPPFGRNIGLWTGKALLDTGRLDPAQIVVSILPAWTDREWFHRDVLNHAEILWIRGRTKFGGLRSSPPWGCFIAIWRPQ